MEVKTNRKEIIRVLSTANANVSSKFKIKNKYRIRILINNKI